MFYYNTKNYEKAKQVLANISKFNGVKPQEPYFFDAESIASE
jgi:hypothetical protein